MAGRNPEIMAILGHAEVPAAGQQSDLVGGDNLRTTASKGLSSSPMAGGTRGACENSRQTAAGSGVRRALEEGTTR